MRSEIASKKAVDEQISYELFLGLFQLHVKSCQTLFVEFWRAFKIINRVFVLVQARSRSEILFQSAVKSNPKK